MQSAHLICSVRRVVDEPAGVVVAPDEVVGAKHAALLCVCGCVCVCVDGWVGEVKVGGEGVFFSINMGL